MPRPSIMSHHLGDDEQGPTIIETLTVRSDTSVLSDPLTSNAERVHSGIPGASGARRQPIWTAASPPMGIPSGTTAPVMLEVVDSNGSVEGNVVLPTASQISVSATVSVCCAPKPLVTIQTYLDLNNNAAMTRGSR